MRWPIGAHHNITPLQPVLKRNGTRHLQGELVRAHPSPKNVRES